MKHLLIIIVALVCMPTADATPLLFDQLNLCPMSDGVKLDLPCIARNMDVTAKKIDEILARVEAEDVAKDISPKLPQLVAAGREYTRLYCAADIEMMRGQYATCLVHRDLELIRDISCIARFPIRHSDYAEILTSYCEAATDAP
jgi:hypothetical protein